MSAGAHDVWVTIRGLKIGSHVAWSHFVRVTIHAAGESAVLYHFQQFQFQWFSLLIPMEAVSQTAEIKFPDGNFQRLISAV
jgi:hypothetical protein